MDRFEDSALVQGVSENFVEGAGAERETTGAQREQTPPVVEFED
jgi:hypothetical protein